VKNRIQFQVQAVPLGRSFLCLIRQNRRFTESMLVAKENRLVMVLKQVKVANVRYWHKADGNSAFFVHYEREADIANSVL